MSNTAYLQCYILALSCETILNPWISKHLKLKVLYSFWIDFLCTVKLNVVQTTLCGNLNSQNYIGHKQCVIHNICRLFITWQQYFVWQLYPHQIWIKLIPQNMQKLIHTHLPRATKDVIGSAGSNISINNTQLIDKVFANTWSDWPLDWPLDH